MQQQDRQWAGSSSCLDGMAFSLLLQAFPGGLGGRGLGVVGGLGRSGRLLGPAMRHLRLLKAVAGGAGHVIGGLGALTQPGGLLGWGQAGGRAVARSILPPRGMIAFPPDDGRVLGRVCSRLR